MATTDATTDSRTAWSTSAAEKVRRRRAGRFEHREVADALERGQVDDRADDGGGDDPEQHAEQPDGLRDIRERSLQVLARGFARHVDEARRHRVRGAAHGDRGHEREPPNTIFCASSSDVKTFGRPPRTVWPETVPTTLNSWPLMPNVSPMSTFSFVSTIASPGA